MSTAEGTSTAKQGAKLQPATRLSSSELTVVEHSSDRQSLGTQDVSIPGTQAISTPGAQANSTPCARSVSTPGVQAVSTPGAQAVSAPGAQAVSTPPLPGDQRPSQRAPGLKPSGSQLTWAHYTVPFAKAKATNRAFQVQPAPPQSRVRPPLEPRALATDLLGIVQWRESSENRTRA
jgi:hypothetical protein